MERAPPFKAQAIISWVAVWTAEGKIGERIFLQNAAIVNFRDFVFIRYKVWETILKVSPMWEYCVQQTKVLTVQSDNLLFVDLRGIEGE